MKQLLIFSILGPPLGMATGLLGAMPMLCWWLGDRAMLDYHQIVLLPLAYMIGGLPAIIVALFDWLLARHHAPWRIVWTALFAFCAAFVPLLPSILHRFIHGYPALLFGILGVVPGAICSYLSGRWERSRLR